MVARGGIYGDLHGDGREVNTTQKTNDLADFKAKSERNARVRARYDELMHEGKHGHYETMFRVVREEVERAAANITHVAPENER